MGMDIAAGPDLMAYAVGTPGEFDWQPIFARSPQEALRTYLFEHRGYDAAEVAEFGFDPDYVSRVETWDRLSNIRGADWYDAGLGYCCERCGCESHAESGGRVVAGEVVCESCLTLDDRATIDPDDVIEDLANRIADDGIDDVRDWLVTRGHWAAVEALWPQAIAASAAP